ncbi:MAG: aminotransferase [Actinophytocola sp.]|nr:aminotransferase [Actinophytocola sp.]
MSANGTRRSTTPRVLFVQHQDDCPPGHVGERILQRGAQVEVVRAQRPELPDPRRYDLIVSLGSYGSVLDDSASHVRREEGLLTAALESGVGVFGICFGAQLLSKVLGGDVYPAPDGPEIGWLEVDTEPAADGLLDKGPWLVWHLDVMTTPPGGVELARTGVGMQAFRHGDHLGVQFHPEAMMESVLAWADHYRDLLEENGVDYERLITSTRDLAPDTRRQAYDLTDRVLDQTGVLAATRRE